MNLTKIEERLSLFSDYLKYRIDAKFTQMGFTYTPEYIMRAFERHGFLINLRDIGVPLLSFDQWLVLYDREDLAIDPKTITIGTNPMMQVVKYGGQEVPYSMLGSYDFFKYLDQMLTLDLELKSAL